VSNILSNAQPYLLELTGYHGVDPSEILAQQAGIDPNDIIKLNGNENLYGPSPLVKEALLEFNGYNFYPDPLQRSLRESLAEYAGVSAQEIVAGNGSDELIDLLLRLFLSPGDKIIQLVPTFGMYSFSATAFGGGVVSVPMNDEFKIDVESIKSSVNDKTKIIILASPNNPTGNRVTNRDIEHLLEIGLPVIVDETYYEFCGKTVISLRDKYENLIILRSFSKWAGIAGLRVGFGVMEVNLAKVLLNMKPPYNMNVAAEIAVKASLKDKNLLVRRIESTKSERDRMYNLIESIPKVEPCSSEANFILCKMPPGCSQKILEHLARSGIFIRSFNTPILRDYVRISVGLPHHTDALIEALKSAVKECV